MSRNVLCFVGDSRMKKTIAFTMALTLLCFVQSGFGTTVIDFPTNNNSVAIAADMAQLITVPLGSDTRLDSFQFYDMIGAGGPVTFSAMVYEFDPVTTTTIGNPLYDSGVRSATSDSRKTYVFSTGGINLKPGGHYILDLRQLDYGNSGNLDIGASGDTYAGGQFMFYYYGWYTDLPHTLVQSLAFQAVFNPVPEPSTLILLGMAFISPLAYAWRARERG